MFYIKPDLRSYTYSELKDTVVQLGLPEFRAKQIFKWIHSGVTSFDEMTDLSKDFREDLKKVAKVTDIKIKVKQVSSDGTIKY